MAEEGAFFFRLDAPPRLTGRLLGGTGGGAAAAVVTNVDRIQAPNQRVCVCVSWRSRERGREKARGWHFAHSHFGPSCRRGGEPNCRPAKARARRARGASDSELLTVAPRPSLRPRVRRHTALHALLVQRRARRTRGESKGSSSARPLWIEVPISEDLAVAPRRRVCTP